MCVWRRGKLALVAILCQIMFLIIFGFLVEYDEIGEFRKKPHPPDSSGNEAERLSEFKATDIERMYGMWQDVHVMMLIGFGFLMTFLKRYGFSSVGFNFMLCAFIIQWSTIIYGLLHLEGNKILVSISTMFTADFACAAVLISFGAVLGKTSATQLLIMALIEVVLQQVNEWIGIHFFRAPDVGESMYVHVFGAYFGLAVSRVLHRDSLRDDKVEEKASSNYHSDLFSMVGTIFLWMFWPSFNAGVAATPDAQMRAVLHTYYSLCACTVVVFALSALTNKHDKFAMEHIQNATLAGGVAVGTVADMNIGVWGAILTGMVAGTVSTLGFKYLSPLLKRHRLHDTCGVNNLHGMPGLMAGLSGILVAYLAKYEDYGPILYTLYRGRAPSNQTEIDLSPNMYAGVEAGDDYSRAKQAGMQAAALGLTLGMALVGGTITGAILKLPIWNKPPRDEMFEDTDWWETPEGYPNGGLERPERNGNAEVDIDDVTIGTHRF